MRRFSAFAWLIVSFVVFSQLAQAGRGSSSHPSGAAVGQGPIMNRVIDLLDDDVDLVWGGDLSSWESEAFATGQFTRIGLKGTLLAEVGQVNCFTLWQFSTDDEFVDSAPRISLGLFELPGLRLTGPLGFTEVFGVQAKIRCEAAGGSSGTLTDVKVLLRRE